MLKKLQKRRRKSKMDISDEIVQFVNNEHLYKIETDEGLLAKQYESEILWTRKATELVIYFRGDMDALFDKPSFKKHKLWEKIAERMHENGYHPTGAECHTKWRNLLKTFKKNLEKSKTGGGAANKITWEHYDSMDKAIGVKVRSLDTPTNSIISSSFLPTSSSVSSSFAPSSSSPSSKVCAADLVLDTPNGTSLSSDTSGCETATTTTTDTRKRKIDDKPPAWFQTYLKEKRREQHKLFEAQKELEERKLQAINRLTTLLEIIAKK